MRSPVALASHQLLSFDLAREVSFVLFEVEGADCAGLGWAQFQKRLDPPTISSVARSCQSSWDVRISLD